MDNVSHDYILSKAMSRWGLSPKRHGKEWHSPCFRCGGTDRFILFENGGYWCRQCGVKGWCDDDQKNYKPDPLAMQRHAEEIARRKAEQDALNRKWQEGYRAGYWRGYHDGMAAVNRAWWLRRGVTNEQIDFYGLGYTPTKHVETEQGTMVLPAYTIPIRDPQSWEIVNIQYRLADPPAGVGKYRQEPNITAAAFYAEVANEGSAIVLEGAIKAMVIHERIGGTMQVIGLPGCTPGEIVLDKLKSFHQIYLVLDPGCDEQARRIKNQLPQVRIANLAEKPDDAFLSGLTVDQFRACLQQAW